MNVDVLVIRIGDERAGVLFRYALEGAQPLMRFVVDDAFAALPRDRAPVLSQAFVADSSAQQRSFLLNVLEPVFNGRPGRDGDAQLPAFFQNLLPEGVFRDHVAALAGCAPRDHFALLAACGLDLPGAVTARWENLDRLQLQHLVTQDQDALEVTIGAEPFQDQVSLSGVQPKLSVLRDGAGRYVGRTRLHDASAQAGHDTHIIAKLPAVGFARMPEVEHLSLTIAQAAGVNACAHELVPLARLVAPHDYDLGEDLPDERGRRTDESRHFLAVERFDRSPAGRVHCEDFAQVLAVAPEDKYTRSYAEIAAVLLALPGCGEPAVHELLRRLVVNELIGNADAHLKNIGLIYRDGRTAELSPAYDIVALCLYGAQTGHALRLLPASFDATPASRQSLLTPVSVRNFCAALQINAGPATAVLRDTVAQAATRWPALIRASAMTTRQKRMLLARVGAHTMTRQVLARKPALRDDWAVEPPGTERH